MPAAEATAEEAGAHEEATAMTPGGLRCPALGAVMLCWAFAAAVGQPVDGRDRIAGWRADLDQFAENVPHLHVNAFHHISRGSFDAMVVDLRRRLRGMDADEFWVGLDRIENAIGDGHTFMRMPADAPRFGLEFRRFGGDYRVVAVAPGLPTEHVLGTRLVAIDDVRVAEVRRRVLALTPQDELAPLREFRAQALLANGLVLRGLEVAKRRDVVRYMLADDAGRRTGLRLRSGDLPPRATWRVVGGRTVQGTPAERAMRCGPVGAGDTVLCEFRSYEDLERTASRVFEAVRSNGARRLIIDMRENNGGNFCKGLKYLVDPIAHQPALNRSRALYVLVGPQTFSAAMSNAAHFRQLTRAVLVGQPIGERPNSYQEIEELRLAHTGWTATYSTRFYRFTNDPGNVIRPDVTVATTWDDYRSGRDPVLARVLSLPMPGGEPSDLRTIPATASERATCGRDDG